MRKLTFNLDRKSLETIYLTFIRPILEYGDVLWDNCSQYDKNELEKNTERSSQNRDWSNKTSIFKCSI